MTREEREAALGRERKPALKRVDDTPSTPKSWVGAVDCRGTGTWIRYGREAELDMEQKLGLQRVGDTLSEPKSRVGAGGLPRDRNAD